jgi:hypothetical protein
MARISLSPPGYGGKKGNPLGTDGEAVGDVLHIAAGDDFALGR